MSHKLKMLFKLTILGRIGNQVELQLGKRRAKGVGDFASPVWALRTSHLKYKLLQRSLSPW